MNENIIFCGYNNCKMYKNVDKSVCYLKDLIEYLN